MYKINKMKHIPTAEEFLKRDESGVYNEVDITKTMIEFAKLHVEATLRAAVLEAHTKDVPYTDDVEVDENSILNSYPLKNIK